jgi:hypothetical protein
LIATTIKRCAWVLVAMVALSAALVVLSPDVVEAQSPDEAATVSTLPVSDAQVQDNAAMPQQQLIYEPATLRAVNPGDSLWVISQQRLEPDPDPGQIMNEVGRIYELNQDLIGNDPNLIFPGQELLLPAVYKPAVPAVVSEQPAVVAEQAPLEEAAPEQATEEVAQELVPESVVLEQEAPPKEVTPEQVAEPINSGTGAVSGQQTSEEDAPAVATRSVPPWPQDSYSEQYSEEDARNNMLLRRLLGLGIIVLSVLVAILIAWRLPLRRNVDDPVRWGIPREYYEYQRHAPETVNDLNKEKKSGLASESLQTAQGPNSPTKTENAASASVAREEEVYTSLSARRRRARLRKIHQRTSRPRRQPPVW